jgi:hypothetical protein
MFRIDFIWLATEPMDMRAGTETALARVIAVFGAAKPWYWACHGTAQAPAARSHCFNGCH